ncbi:MAG: polyphenol oxidase family protein [Muribaculaceae bacterium]
MLENQENISMPLEILCDTPEAFAASTLRGDVVQGDPYSGFSVCHYTGDNPEHVAVCRRELCSRLGVDTDHLIVPRQTHSVSVLYIGPEEPLPVVAGRLDEVDAIVTDRPGIVVGVNTADCVPVVLVDSIGRRGAVIHAGWRGAVAGIVPRTLDEMTARGSRPADIRAFIGPCIRVEDFEVGEEVAARFPECCVDRSYGERPHVDLSGFVARQLADVGVTAVTPPAASTLSHPDKYFSARALGISSGRIFTFLRLRTPAVPD